MQNNVFIDEGIQTNTFLLYFSTLYLVNIEWMVWKLIIRIDSGVWGLFLFWRNTSLLIKADTGAPEAEWIAQSIFHAFIHKVFELNS